MYKFLLIFLLLTSPIFSQKSNAKQEEVARKMIELVVKGDVINSWELFDQKRNPDVSAEQFSNAIQIMSKNLEVFDKLDLYMTGIKLQNDELLNLYTFKAISTTQRIVGDIQIDIIFFKDSNLVYGVLPKKRIDQNSSKSSIVDEIEVDKGFTATINNIDYEILGVNLVPFSKTEALLVIQVSFNLESNELDDEKLNKEGIKFAKYLITHDYLVKGEKVAKEHEMTLKSEIGVSYYNKKNTLGYNVMLKRDLIK